MMVHGVRSAMIIAMLVFGNGWCLGNTKGVPLGGFGTGYVVFDARSGDFATSRKVPPAASDDTSEFSNKKSSSCGFHFFANGQSIKKAKNSSTEDAKLPLYKVTFDPVGKVTFSLNACAPFVPGDSPLYEKLAHSPLAFFEMTAVNGNSVAVDAAAALEFSNTSGFANLLGGADSGMNDATANNKAVSFDGAASDGNAFLQVDCDGAGAVFSAGALGDFLTTGVLTNGAGNIVAAKCTIPAGGSARFKFVLSWWRTFVSTVDRYGSGHVDEENYYYHNYYADSKAAGEFGMGKFDVVVNGVKSMVNRVMGSNFPEWYKDRLLNNLYPLMHNSQCAKDGRVAFWEGQWPIIGTFDQGEHAGLWYTFNWPGMQWRELQYRARTSHPGVGNDAADLKGQIHHDLNSGPEKWTPDAHFLCPWDNWQHDDYFWNTNTTDWADLNSMFIFKAYQLMLATGSRDSLKTYFPYIKSTGDRLMRHGTLYGGPGMYIPLRSKGSYDTNRELTPNYNGGLALAAYLAVVEMAKYVGEDSVAARYQNWYDLGRKQYKDSCDNSGFGSGKDLSEGDVGGYSWARFLCLPAIMDSGFIVNACQRLWNYYSAQSTLLTKLGRFHFYTYDHWGGAAIAIGKPDTAMIIHKWDYDYYYTGNPPYVYWQGLFASNSRYSSYMTGPCVWRSYFQMTGYMLDNANNRLWIRPSIPGSMGKKITDAPLVNPRGWGTLTYDENPAGTLFQSMTVAFDSVVAVKEIVLKNNTTTAQPGVSIKQDGAPVAGAHAQIEGSGFEKNIRITLDSPLQIGPGGVEIKVYNGPVAIGRGMGCSYAVRHAPSLNAVRLGAGLPIRYAVDAAGPISLELIGLNGAKMGELMRSNVSEGNHVFIWNGKLPGTANAGSGVVVMRLRSSSGTVSRLVFVGK